MKTHTSFFSAPNVDFARKNALESAITMPYYIKELARWKDYLAVFDKIHENLKKWRTLPRPTNGTGKQSRMVSCFAGGRESW